MATVSGGTNMWFAVFYVLAILVLIAHFSGWLARRNLEWVVLLLGILVFPAVIFL
ncbi:MAG: hypothetical protein AB8D52_03010 [Gammaproteobacteria bacterium]